MRVELDEKKMPPDSCDLDAKTFSPEATQIRLLGWPVDHSKSPAMHNAAFKAQQLDDWRYDLEAVPPGSLATRVQQLQSDEQIRGVNLTIPHKQALLSTVDFLCPVARAIKAVNVLVFDQGKIWGYNTDVEGIKIPLENSGLEVHLRKVVILGTGGAARAAAAAVVSLGAARISIAGRSLPRATALCKELCQGLDLETRRLQPKPLANIDPHDFGLLINATSVGLENPQQNPLPHWQEPRLEWPSDCALFDCVYAAKTTALMASARSASVIHFDGLEMLLYQGVRAYELWTQRPAPIEQMRVAIQQHL